MRSATDRAWNIRSIVTTKALTQAAGHVVKIGYYAWVSNAVLDEFDIADVPIWLVGAGMVLAVAGCRDRLSAAREVQRPSVPARDGLGDPRLGALCIVKRARGLLVA